MGYLRICELVILCSLIQYTQNWFSKYVGSWIFLGFECKRFYITVIIFYEVKYHYLENLMILYFYFFSIKSFPRKLGMDIVPFDSGFMRIESNHESTIYFILFYFCIMKQMVIFLRYGGKSELNHSF